jgi:hypothetical protein
MKSKCFLLVLASVLYGQTLDATTRTVTSLNDDGGAGTLRSLIAASIANDTIVFTDGLAGTITLISGELVIGRNLSIIGPDAAGLTVSGNGASRVFHVTNATVHISSLTISNGRAAGTNGANGMVGHNDGFPGSDGIGGGILNNGNLILTRCTLNGNSANGGNGGGYCTSGCSGSFSTGPAGGAGFGGGIYNNGTLTLTNCTLFANSAKGGSGGSSPVRGGTGGTSSGGAIFNQGNLTFVNCTLSTNTATGGSGGFSTFSFGGNGGVAQGGGLYNANSLSILNTIIANGTITGGTGGQGNQTTGGNGSTGATLSPDVFGAINSQGHNLIRTTDGSGGWVGSDLTGTVAAPLNPLLGSLADNGGTTRTVALQPTSAAIDAGDDSVTNSLATDQRGRPRQSGTHVDIGAYEVNPPFTLVVSNINDNGIGSLRQTLLDAFPADTITFATNVVGTIALTSGELLVVKPLVISGPTNSRLVISGNNASRVFHITGGPVNISGLTIANGNSAGTGGGFYCDFGGSLVLCNCTVSGNTTLNNGGAIANNGSVEAYNCTFSGNQALNAGGIYTYAGPVLLRGCTIVSNSASGSGGGLLNYSLVAGTSNYITGTLVASNTALLGHDDVIGVFTSGGYNFIGRMDYTTPGGGNAAGVPTSGLTNGVKHDQVGSLASPLDPLIGPLQDNGGPSFTHALKPGSPAIDKGISNSLPTDQRGAPRPFDFLSVTNASDGDGSDIGAFESGSPPLNIQNTGNTVVLSWPWHYGGFTLQSATNAAASNTWTIVAGAPVVVGNQFQQTNSVVSSNRFFRLSGN